MNYIFLLLSDVLLAMNFVVTKMYQNKMGTSFMQGLKFNALLGE